MDKWQDLARNMLAENSQDEVFLEARIAPDLLREAYSARRAVTVEQDGQIIAFGGLWPTDRKDWFELGSLWVHPAHRGKGLGIEVYERRLKLLPHEAHCFVITHNPKVIAIAGKFGFRTATKADWLTIAPYELTCGPCDRKVADKKNCPHMAIANECLLLVL